MKKEVIFAILIGLILGLIVTYGIYRARTTFISVTGPHNQLNASATPEPSGSVHNSLTLVSPDDESVQSSRDVKITGVTDPNAIVIIFVNDRQRVTNADNSGNFSVSDKLDKDGNTIIVRTIDENGNVAEEKRTVIISTTPFDQVPTASFSATTTTTKSTQK